MGVRELRAKYDPIFKHFWDAYPRKVDRQESLDILAELGESGEDIESIIKQAESFGRNVDPENLQYVPSPKNWLKGRRWEDNDLFTDQRVSTREWFVRAWREADAAAVEKKYGFVYPDPPIPPDVQDVLAWCRDDRMRWVGIIANHILNGAPLPS